MAGEAGPAINPIEQFSLTPIVPIEIAHRDFSLTNSSLYMLLAVAHRLRVDGGRARAAGPGFPAGFRRSPKWPTNSSPACCARRAARTGMRFFPLVFSIFMFVLICNLVGLIPYSFTVTSHIIVTAALALLVFFTVVIVGLKEHGLHFFKLFVPSDVPIYILPLVVAIEIISFLTRPLSHSVRLFANMLAGHITLNVFGGFVVMLLGAGAATKVLAVLPFAMTIGLDALELLVAFLQAYVFAMLTCMYLNDALHPGGH